MAIPKKSWTEMIEILEKGTKSFIEKEEKKIREEQELSRGGSKIVHSQRKKAKNNSNKIFPSRIG